MTQIIKRPLEKHPTLFSLLKVGASILWPDGQSLCVIPSGIEPYIRAKRTLRGLYAESFSLSRDGLLGAMLYIELEHCYGDNPTLQLLMKSGAVIKVFDHHLIPVERHILYDRHVYPLDRRGIAWIVDDLKRLRKDKQLTAIQKTL